jgi:hypothetical protein
MRKPRVTNLCAKGEAACKTFASADMPAGISRGLQLHISLIQSDNPVSRCNDRRVLGPK